MPMNPSMVIQYIDMHLGASIQVIELTHEDILNVIETQTLPTFSNYYPHLEMMEVVPSRDKVPGRFNTFYLKTDLEILGVSKVLSENYLGNSGLPLAYYDSDPVNRQMTADVASMFFQPITWDFEEPNILSIYPKTLLIGNFTVQIKTPHAPHLATIPLKQRELFLKLALYDVRIALYPIRERFKSINTTFGNLELFMDKLDSAVDDRENLLEKFREDFAKNPKRRKIYIA